MGTIKPVSVQDEENQKGTAERLSLFDL